MSFPESLRFGASGRIELQPRERRLRLDGQPVTLGARTFDLLLALTAQPDRLLTKSELLDTVWPGVVVEESNLHVQVSTLRKLLGGDVIATVPGRGYRFAAPLHFAESQGEGQGEGEAEAEGTAAPGGPATAAPPVTASHLVGRDADIAAIVADLQRVHCLSIVGPGGVGKTSLARVVAERGGLRSVWVDLAPIADDAQVAVQALRAGGQPVGEGAVVPQLVAALTAEPVLLVLDNAEHVIDAVATLVAELLPALPQLRVLVTSQVVLQGAWEAVYRLSPLPLASVDGAQALLAQRITAADRRFVLDERTQPLIDAICRQLDGLPLALEMAAARVPLLGLKRVHDELAHRFALLTAGRREAASRHRTLHAALDWSYGLLGADEQRLFRALGLWADGFTLELAVAQGADDTPSARWDVIEHLAALVDRSLVVASADDPPRYRLLETMRAYALEQLAAQGEEDAARRCQGQALLALLRFSDADNQPSPPERRSEIVNVGAALPWLLQHHFDVAVALCIYCAQHDTFTRWRGQASLWMEAMEPRLRGAEGLALPPALRLGWWTAFARTLVLRRNVRAKALAREVCTWTRDAGDAEQLHLALVVLVRALEYEPSHAEVEAACVEIEALAAAHPAWPPRRRLLTVGVLSLRAMRRGDATALVALRRQELALALEMGNRDLADAVHTNLLNALHEAGQDEEVVQMAGALIPRLQQQRSASLPWGYCFLLIALHTLDRRAEFDALVPVALANAWQESSFTVLEPMLARLRREGRLDDGARLLGLGRRIGASTGDDVLTTGEEPTLMREAAERTFDAATLQRLYAEGGTLDEAGVLALMRATRPA